MSEFIVGFILGVLVVVAALAAALFLFIYYYEWRRVDRIGSK